MSYELEIIREKPYCYKKRRSDLVLLDSDLLYGYQIAFGKPLSDAVSIEEGTEILQRGV